VGALSGIRVVDFSLVRTGVQASQILADFGADVVQIEPMGGHPLRSEAAWPLWGRGKRALQLDLKDASDVETARALCAEADVVIEAFKPGTSDRLGIGYDRLAAANPRLVHCAITGFGRDNRYSHVAGYDAIINAKFGALWAMEGMADRPGPAFGAVEYASFAATQLALQGILAALYEREASGRGQHVETSLAQALTAYDPFGWFSRAAITKFGGELEQPPRIRDGVPTGGLSFRLLIALTKDGRWLQFSQTTDRLFRAMMRMFGLEWMFDDPEWKEIPNFSTQEQRARFWEMLLTTVRSKTADEWLAEFDREPNVWGEMFRRDTELLQHPQMLWNKMVLDVEDRDLGALRAPGPLALLSRTAAIVDRPAPRLNEHDQAIRREAAATHPAPRSIAGDVRSGNLPLEGVTIVELATYYAAPFGATLLGELGARIIKLEELNGDPLRMMLPFPEIGALRCLMGKESVAVDLATPEGRSIAHRIIADADIVLQSFRGGVAERLGLDPDTLRAINPRLIYHSAPGYGIDGPYARRPAFAPTIGAAAGIAWRNAGPVIPENADMNMMEIRRAANQLGTAVMGVGNSDGLAALSVGTTMLLGLLARERGDGEGQDLFTSMLSSTAHGLSPVMIEYAGRPEPAKSDSNLYGYSALYRLYEAADDWVFLAAPQLKEWDRLIAALPGGAALASDPRFVNATARSAQDEALAEALSSIFATRTADAWEESLCAAGVACVRCRKGPPEANYMHEDTPGWEMGLVTTTRHPLFDEMPRIKPFLRFSRSTTVATDAGLTGQDTHAVLSEFGYGEEEIGAFAAKGVIGLG